MITLPYLLTLAKLLPASHTMTKFASVTSQRAELLALYREGVIDAGVLRESLASLARETADPPAAPAAPQVAVAPARSATQKTNARKRASRERKKALAEQVLQEAELPELTERVLPAPSRRGAKRAHLASEPEPEPEPEPEREPDVAKTLKWIVVRTYEDVAGQTRIRDSTMDVPYDHPSAQDPRVLIDLAEPLTVARLTEDRRELGGMKGKLGMTFQVTKIQIDAGGTQSTTTENVSRWCKMTALPVAMTDEELTRFVSVNCAKILEEVEKYLQNGSG